MILQEFFRPENLPFALALTLMLTLGLVQLIALLLGLGALGLESTLPDAATELDMELGIVPEGGAGGNLFSALLSWLNLGKVPLLVSLIALLFLFAFIGFNLQALLVLTLGLRLPAPVAAIAAGLLALPPLRLANGLLARIVPKDETLAVSQQVFIGRVATITLGTATAQRAAEARLLGPHGHRHYIMVVPDDPAARFTQGEAVLVVSRDDRGHYHVIAVDNPHLTAGGE